jgi:hypothetical protein
MTPQAFGYKGDDVHREMIAESIRIYMADPNYLKSVAPKTAKAIRRAVNGNPAVNRILQFNNVPWAADLPGAEAAALIGARNSEEED